MGLHSIKLMDILKEVEYEQDPNRTLYKIYYLDGTHSYVLMTPEEYAKQPLTKVARRDDLTGFPLPEMEALDTINTVYQKSRTLSLDVDYRKP
jgi:hypothetical protein